MTATQYRFTSPNDPEIIRWSETRETHIAVAIAIHAISDRARTPDDIWEAPTSAEVDHVTMAVENYIRAGLIEPEPDGRYPWGAEPVEVPLAKIGGEWFGVGDEITAGRGNDRDTGRIVSIEGDQVEVAWDSGVRTTQHLDALQVED